MKICATEQNFHTYKQQELMVATGSLEVAGGIKEKRNPIEHTTLSPRAGFLRKMGVCIQLQKLTLNG